jgi:hypothetical protein
LNVAVLAAGIPRRYRNARAELEVLTRTGGEVFYVSLDDDGDLVWIAQKTVAAIARRFAADVEFDRRESNACPWCPTYSWCQPTLNPSVLAAQAPAIADDEFADDEPPF